MWCGQKDWGGCCAGNPYIGLFGGREGKDEDDYSILVLSKAFSESNRRITYLTSAKRVSVLCSWHGDKQITCKLLPQHRSGGTGRQ